MGWEVFQVFPLSFLGLVDFCGWGCFWVLRVLIAGSISPAVTGAEVLATSGQGLTARNVRDGGLARFSVRGFLTGLFLTKGYAGGLVHVRWTDVCISVL